MSARERRKGECTYKTHDTIRHKTGTERRRLIPNYLYITLRVVSSFVVFCSFRHPSLPLLLLIS